MANVADDEGIGPIRIAIGELGADLAGYRRQVRKGRSLLIVAPEGDVADCAHRRGLNRLGACLERCAENLDG